MNIVTVILKQGMPTIIWDGACFDRWLFEFSWSGLTGLLYRQSLKPFGRNVEFTFDLSCEITGACVNNTTYYLMDQPWPYEAHKYFDEAKEILSQKQLIEREQRLAKLQLVSELKKLVIMLED